jgi:hypothetical protein
VRTLGIDLAAQPANTSVCAIDWGPSAPVLSDLRAGVNDEALLEAISEADKVGIDAPGSGAQRLGPLRSGSWPAPTTTASTR